MVEGSLYRGAQREGAHTGAQGWDSGSLYRDVQRLGAHTGAEGWDSSWRSVNALESANEYNIFNIF